MFIVGHIIDVVIDAFFNYLFIWLPLLLLYFVVRCALPKSVKRRVRGWLESPPDTPSPWR
jgi:hypothetical protein